MTVPSGVATYTNIVDRRDLARIAGGTFIPNSQVVRDNPDTYRTIVTNFKYDNEGGTGNYHSLYLYLQRAEVQQALSAFPQNLTRPF